MTNDDRRLIRVIFLEAKSLEKNMITNMIASYIVALYLLGV